MYVLLALPVPLDRPRPPLLVVKIFLLVASDEILAYRANVSEERSAGQSLGYSTCPQDVYARRISTVARNLLGCVAVLARGGGRSVVAGGEVEGLEGGVVVVGVIYLEGGVGDPELVGEELFEVAAAGVAVLLVADEDVGG